MKLLAAFRSFALPLGMILAERGLAYAAEDTEARAQELAALDEEISRRTAHLQTLPAVGRRPAVPTHVPDCTWHQGDVCDSPEACKLSAERIRERRRQLQHSTLCPVLEGGPCSDPYGECTELHAFYGTEEPDTEEERPAPSPAKEEFPLEPVDEHGREIARAARRADQAHTQALTAAGMVVGALLIAAAAGLRARYTARRHTHLVADRPVYARPRTQDEVREAYRQAGANLETAGPVDLAALGRLAEDQAEEPDPFRCPWECGWAPSTKVPKPDRQLRQSLHANDCGRRPAAMTVMPLR